MAIKNIIQSHTEEAANNLNESLPNWTATVISDEQGPFIQLTNLDSPKSESEGRQLMLMPIDFKNMESIDLYVWCYMNVNTGFLIEFPLEEGEISQIISFLTSPFGENY